MFRKVKEFFKKHKNLFLGIVLVICTISFVIFKLNSMQNTQVEKITYNKFMEMVYNDEVDTVSYNKNNEWMTITLFNEDTKNMSYEDRCEYSGYTNKDKRMVLYPATDEFRRDLLVHNIILIYANEEANFAVVFSNILSIAFPILWFVVLIVMLKNSFSAEINKNEILQTSDVRFDDIIGHDEILDDIKFITKLIQNPKIGDKIGTKIPKGILLSGAPGCGKTLIAKAIAGEAGVPFLYQNASSFIDRFVGVGAKHVRDLFKLAKQNAPCVLFIDEIDAIGMDRDNNKGTSEHDQTIDALLQEMDGFSSRDGIFIIAATNRPDILDKALTRAGRFDRQIVVSAPRDWKIRKDLFDHYLSNFSVSDDVDTENIAKQVSGFTGADIAAICNEASMVATMAEKDFIDRDCIEEAIDKKIFKGNRSKKNRFEKDRLIIAYHEAGHAVMSYLLEQPIARASIQSTVSGVGGAVFNSEKEDGLLRTKEDYINDIYICYAGRASEELKFKSITTGASNDITQATELMAQYFERLGFDENFGLLDIGLLSNNHLVNSEDITEKLSQMSKKLYSECRAKLAENYYLVEKLAKALLKEETLSGAEIDKLFNNN